MMNGYGDGFQYCNSSLYEVIECQKSLMLDFKSEILLLLIMGIGVLGLCFFFMVPFCYSVIKIENDFWNNLRKKAVRNYSEMKQALLERLRSVHSYHEFLYSNRIPSRLIFNFKNYWKFIWRFFIYFIAVIAFSVINIIYLYENCTNYLAYRPEVLLELIRTKILINTLAISASNLQYDVIGFPLNDLLNIHNYQNSLTIFQDSISELRDSIVLLRSPKYQPILSNNFQTIYYENDRQSLPYFNYWDYGAYAAEEEIINTSYMIANIDLSKGDTYWNWVLNLTFLRTNYETFISEADSYSQSVIEGQLNLIVAAFFIFAVISIIIYFALCFVFFKSEKKYLQKINSMMSIMPV
ncbi:unnamed protein product [Blepharisma stoltei]|uniref:Uncharacterized protein n=1 Tax=Blepharisma stoltei TaxID=1481888 RepID=A0AAU9I764_9CILI|nr:unnamed protein product [Blepharisma stoltei]